jgi:CHAT domain-containing protein
LREGREATPNGFALAQPGKSSILHISAHAISFPESPLDSYIVLSPETTGEYKLYARDLAKLRLSAKLVTLSACQSAGAKNVPGEGLVRLTWAVLSAGARNVVASLWNAGDSSTAFLMSKLYSNLNEHEAPAQALYAAKLDMLKHKYVTKDWAAFHLYAR